MVAPEDVCEMCTANEAVIYCRECQVSLCLIGGCDGELHAEPLNWHHRIDHTRRDELPEHSALCDICRTNEATLFCHDCRSRLCTIGGCDAELHAPSNQSNPAIDFTQHQRTKITGESFTKPNSTQPSKLASPRRDNVTDRIPPLPLPIVVPLPLPSAPSIENKPVVSSSRPLPSRSDVPSSSDSTPRAESKHQSSESDSDESDTLDEAVRSALREPLTQSSSSEFDSDTASESSATFSVHHEQSAPSPRIKQSPFVPKLPINRLIKSSDSETDSFRSTVSSQLNVPADLSSKYSHRSDDRQAAAERRNQMEKRMKQTRQRALQAMRDSFSKARAARQAEQEDTRKEFARRDAELKARATKISSEERDQRNRWIEFRARADKLIAERDAKHADKLANVEEQEAVQRRQRRAAKARAARIEREQEAQRMDAMVAAARELVPLDLQIRQEQHERNDSNAESAIAKRARHREWIEARRSLRASREDAQAALREGMNKALMIQQEQRMIEWEQHERENQVRAETLRIRRQEQTRAKQAAEKAAREELEQLRTDKADLTREVASAKQAESIARSQYQTLVVPRPKPRSQTVSRPVNKQSINQSNHKPREVRKHVNNSVRPNHAIADHAHSHSHHASSGHPLDRADSQVDQNSHRHRDSQHPQDNLNRSSSRTSYHQSQHQSHQQSEQSRSASRSPPQHSRRNQSNSSSDSDDGSSVASFGVHHTAVDDCSEDDVGSGESSARFSVHRSHSRAQSTVESQYSYRSSRSRDRSPMQERSRSRSRSSSHSQSRGRSPRDVQYDSPKHRRHSRSRSNSSPSTERDHHRSRSNSPDHHSRQQSMRSLNKSCARSSSSPRRKSVRSKSSSPRDVQRHDRDRHMSRSCSPEWPSRRQQHRSPRPHSRSSRSRSPPRSRSASRSRRHNHHLSDRSFDSRSVSPQRQRPHSSHYRSRSLSPRSIVSQPLSTYDSPMSSARSMCLDVSVPVSPYPPSSNMSTVPCSPVHREHQIDHSITSAIDRRSLKAIKAIVVAQPKRPTSISTQTPAWPSKTVPVAVKPPTKSPIKPLIKPAAKPAAAKPAPVVRPAVVPKPKPVKSVHVIPLPSKTVSAKSKVVSSKPAAAIVKAKPVIPKRAAPKVVKPQAQSEYEEIINSPRNRSLVNEAILNFTSNHAIQPTDSHQYGSFDSDRPLARRRPSVTSDSSSSSDSDSDTSYCSSASSSGAVTPRVDILQKIEIVPAEVVQQQKEIEAQMAAVKQRIKEREARALNQTDLRSQLVANSVNQVCSTIVARDTQQAVSNNQSVRDCEAELAALRAKAKLFHMTQPPQRPMHPVINGQPPRAAYHSSWWPQNTSQVEQDHLAQQRRNMAQTRMY